MQSLLPKPGSSPFFDILRPDLRLASLQTLFSKFENADKQVSDGDPTVIVGGGMAGILLALKLSKPKTEDQDHPGADIVLLESASHLGGRLFFSYPVSLAGQRDYERFLTQWQEFQAKKHMSGFGSELMDATALEILERHFLSQLTDEESAFLEAFLHENWHGAESPRGCFVIKKEFTSLAALVSGSSEIFTKKEAETFKLLLTDTSHKSSAASDSPQPVRYFEQDRLWQEFSKAQKDALLPVLETLCGGPFLKAVPATVQNLLEAFYMTYSAHGAKPAPSLLRHGGLQFGLELILRKRGVDVRTGCTVNRMGLEPSGRYRMSVLDDIRPSRRELYARQLVIATPIASAIQFLPRDFLSPSQARFLGKCRPRSLVALEYSHYETIKSPAWPDECGPASSLLFPVERARGFVSFQNTFILSVSLDFEDSLQAPAVKEAVARLRRAAARVLSPEAIKNAQPGLRIPNSLAASSERIVLLPVAQTYAFDSAPDLRDVKMGKANLYCCGDGFGFSPSPWKNVIDSVNETAGFLTHSKAGKN